MHTPASVRRRRSQVFVEIPPSPFHSSVSRSESTSVAGHTPFKAVPVNVDSRPNASSSSAKMKRKAPDDAQKVPKDAGDVQLPRPKKPKTENALNGSVVKKNDKTPKEVTKGSRDAAGEGDASSSKTPPRNCHQCARTMEPDSQSFFRGRVRHLTASWVVCRLGAVHLQAPQRSTVCSQVLQTLHAQQIWPGYRRDQEDFSQ